VVSFALAFAYRKFAVLPQSAPLRKRAPSFIALLALCVLSFYGLKHDYAEISQNRYVNEIARNGVYELFSAYRNNELDYNHFYLTRPKEEVADFLREKTGAGAGTASPLEHFVQNPKTKKRYNLMFVTVESLSAELLTMFGEERGLTPNLDKLVDQSMFFTNLYATGRRTVYGLSALTLAMPPIPGNSIVRRPDNGNLSSIGHVLRIQGYDTKFIYGGYGYFDNMNTFFAANGYTIVDRNNMAKNEVHFANVWGVADDDLFRKAMKEADASYATGKPFFNMVMTTSNHRPYTYPEGKIDLPSGSGRKGGVKYTDYALGYLIDEAKKHPWFKDTIFVIVADHTHGTSGKSDLDPDKYHIPMWIYAPGIIKPSKVDTFASQIDVVPTVLGVMGISYDSRFFGKDIRNEKPGRAFISNYQKLGYMTKDGVVILQPVNEALFLKKNEIGEWVQQDNVPDQMLNEAIGYYQGASEWRNWSRAE
ncbi:MAG: sulfatase, partial [Micavibrio aeruginosavorus]